MFKLLKIESSGSNQPEPVKIKIYNANEYKRGCAYRLYDNYLLHLNEGDRPTHIACENSAVGEKDSILCFRIQDNMVFEVSVVGESNYYSQSKKYAVAIDSEGSGIGIKPSEENGYLLPYNFGRYAQTGDVMSVRVTTEVTM